MPASGEHPPRDSFRIRQTYRRTNHHNIHLRGYMEEGTITTPFDMTVLIDLDRFQLVMGVIDRLPETGDRAYFYSGCRGIELPCGPVLLC